MNDLFSKALTGLPAYISQVLGLLSGPKAFVLQRDLETPESATEAYTFLAITLFLTLFAQVSILPEQKDYLLTFTSLAVIATFGLIIMAAALYCAWRIVGGKLSFRTSFIVSCYFSGISTLILLVFVLFAAGFLRAKDPANATQILQGATPADPTGAAYVGFMSIVGVGLIAVYVWIFVVWGAYRQLNDVSRGRSAIALTVFTVVSPALLGIQILMQYNLPGQKDPASRLPRDLVGLWKTSDATGPDGGPSLEGTIYDFFATGEYARIHKGIVRQGTCAIAMRENASGRARVEGSVLILSPQKRLATSMNACSQEKGEKSLELDEETYAFEVRHQPTGWMLCLSGRYHQQCLNARAY
jgi:hypothetical protein